MPRSRTLLLGIAMLIACACGGAPATVPSPSPSPTRVPTAIPTTALGEGYAPWALNLDFTGDLTGHVTGTAPPDDLIRDECTGKGSARGGKWASTMAVNVSQKRYALVVLVADYKGAGVFKSGVNVEVNNPDKTMIWQNGTGDVVSFAIGSDEQSGLVDAVLSNAATPANKIRISGHWSCQP